MDNNKVETTLVSCFYQLSYSKHKLFNYVLWMINFFKIKNPKIIYTDKKTYDKLFINIKEPTVKFIIYELDDFLVRNRLTNLQWKHQYAIDPEMFIHNTELYKIWNEKTEMLKKSIENNYFNSDYFLWCDSGCFRDANIIKRYRDWPNSEKLRENKDKIIILNIEDFLFTEISSLNLVDFTNKNRVGGGIFGGHKDICIKWHKYYYEIFNKFLINNLFLGKDQSVMANVYIQSLRNNDNFINLVHIPNDYKKNKWFFLQDYLL